jgi:hypothetical protein
MSRTYIDRYNIHIYFTYPDTIFILYIDRCKMHTLHTQIQDAFFTYTFTILILYIHRYNLHTLHTQIQYAYFTYTRLQGESLEANANEAQQRKSWDIFFVAVSQSFSSLKDWLRGTPLQRLCKGRRQSTIQTVHAPRYYIFIQFTSTIY